MFTIPSLRLWAQGALCGAVTPNLRAACVRMERAGKEYEHDTLIGAFLFDGVVSDDEYDMVDLALTDISAHFTWNEKKEPIMSEAQIKQVDFPQQLPLFNEIMYLRFEPGCEIYKSMQPRELFTKVDFVSLRLSLHWALLGRVTPNLRAIFVGKQEQTYSVSVYYDKSPSSLEIRFTQAIETDLHNDFSALCKKEGVTIETHFHVLSYPAEPSGIFEWVVYFRYEENKKRMPMGYY